MEKNYEQAKESYIVMNGVSFKNIPPVETVQTVFEQCLDKYSPLEVLKENVKIIQEFLDGHLRDAAEEMKGAAKASVTRLSKRVWSTCEYLSTLVDKEKFVNTYFEFILSLQGLGTLNGFGAGKKIGDACYILHGNPEKISLEKCYE